LSGAEFSHRNTFFWVSSEITYQPVSALAFFGSLAGWFGVLTDGWGIISVMYTLERIILYKKDLLMRMFRR